MAGSVSRSRKFSILSAILSSVSVILGVVSFGLPYWIYFDDVIIVSISGTTNAIRMKFHYGFWSYCNDVSTSTQTLNSCGQIKTHSDQEQLTICLVMLSIILSVNSLVNTCLFLLLMKDEKMCLYVTAASALLSGLLSAAADINYGIQDHTAKISVSYTLSFSLSNLSVAFWVSIVNCIVISMSAVFTVVALYYHSNKDTRDDVSTGFPRESEYQYEKQVPTDTISVDNQDVYNQTLYKTPNFGAFEDDSSDDEDIERPLCDYSQDSKEMLVQDDGSLDQMKLMREPTIEIDDNTRQTAEYVSGVWSGLEKDNTMYVPSDTESLKRDNNEETISHQSHGTNKHSDRSIVDVTSGNRREGSLIDHDSRPLTSASSLVNRSLASHSTGSHGGRSELNLKENSDILLVNGNYEVFMLPQSQSKVDFRPDEIAKGYFIPDNEMITFKPRFSPGSSKEIALNSDVRPDTEYNTQPIRKENMPNTSVRRPESKTSSTYTISRQNSPYLGQAASRMSLNRPRTMTPVSVDNTGMLNDDVEISPGLTTHNVIDSLAGSRPTLRDYTDYPDALSLMSKPGKPPLDTRIKTNTVEPKTQISDKQSVTDGVSIDEFNGDPKSERGEMDLINGARCDPQCLNGSTKGVDIGIHQPKKIEIDITGSVFKDVIEIEQMETMSNAVQDGFPSDDLNKAEATHKSTKRKKIAIKFNVAQPDLPDEKSTAPKLKSVRKIPFGRDRKQNRTRPKQPSAKQRPTTAKSIKNEPSILMDENNPYSRPGTAIKREESRSFKENNEVKVMSKKELVKKAAYKRLQKSYQCKLPRMYGTEKQEIFRKLAKIHTESTVMKQDSLKVSLPKSPSIRPKTSKRRLSPSPLRSQTKHTEQAKSGEILWLKEEGGVSFSEV